MEEMVGGGKGEVRARFGEAQRFCLTWRRKSQEQKRRDSREERSRRQQEGFGAIYRLLRQTSPGYEWESSPRQSQTETSQSATLASKVISVQPGRSRKATWTMGDGEEAREGGGQVSSRVRQSTAVSPRLRLLWREQRLKVLFVYCDEGRGVGRDTPSLSDGRVVLPGSDKAILCAHTRPSLAGYPAMDLIEKELQQLAYQTVSEVPGVARPAEKQTERKVRAQRSRSSSKRHSSTPPMQP